MRKCIQIISSAYFNVLNGVRKGALLSPKPFAIYVDDLSQDLAMCKNNFKNNFISENMTMIIK